MTTIVVRGERAEVTIVDVDPDEGLRGWRCTCGMSEVDPEGYVYDTLSDVINEAEIHIDHQCPQEGTARL